MRYAGDLWQLIKSNPNSIDLAETAVYSGVAAGGQALLTDMTPEEIALATSIGAGTAMASRPVGRRVGAALGGLLDKHNPHMLDKYAKYIPVTEEGMDIAVKGTRNLFGEPEAKLMKEALEAKRIQNAFNPDGSPRSNTQTLLSYYLGNRADNVAQAGIALAAPGLLGIEDEQP